MNCLALPYYFDYTDQDGLYFTNAGKIHYLDDFKRNEKGQIFQRFWRCKKDGCHGCAITKHTPDDNDSCTVESLLSINGIEITKHHADHCQDEYNATIQTIDRNENLDSTAGSGNLVQVLASVSDTMLSQEETSSHSKHNYI